MLKLQRGFCIGVAWPYPVNSKKNLSSVRSQVVLVIGCSYWYLICVGFECERTKKFFLLKIACANLGPVRSYKVLQITLVLITWITSLSWESALTNYFPFLSVDPLSVSSFPSPQTSSGTRKFTETRRRCGFLWKMWTAKSSYITSTFCWRASLRRMSTRWSSLFLCSSRFRLNILSGLYQTSGWVRIFGSLSISKFSLWSTAFYFLVGRIRHWFTPLLSDMPSKRYQMRQGETRSCV